MEDSRERREAHELFCCPACDVKLTAAAKAHAHMKNCCPDLLGGHRERWEQVGGRGRHTRPGGRRGGGINKWNWGEKREI